MEIVSSTDGWSTKTGWNRRSSAASFSMCLRNSSRVVAPIVRSSPRASIRFSRVGASAAPAGGRRLRQVGGVDGALGGAGADDRMQLVDEEDDLALRVLDLLEDGLQ